MRVLLWTESFWPNVGGSEVAATTLIDQLRPRGYEFVVITRLDSSDLPNTIDYQGVPVHRFACDQEVVDRVNLDRTNIEEILPMRQRVAKIKRQFKPDIVHVSLPGPSLFLHRFTQGSCWDAPTLVTLHVALIPEEIRPDEPAYEVIRAADWVAACSRDLLEQTRRDIPEIAPHCSHVYNGLPTPPLEPTPLSFDPPHLLCAGRLVEQKGFDTAISALALLRSKYPNARLSIAGDGELKEDLQRHAAESGVAEAVDFPGWVDLQQMPALINAATIILMPSRWEPFGLVALQAAQMARPSIVSNVDGLPEVVEHDKTGLLVDPDNAQALADAIDQLLQDPPRAIEMGQQGQQRASELFSVEKNIEGYERLYHQLISRHLGKQQVHS